LGRVLEWMALGTLQKTIKTQWTLKLFCFVLVKSGLESVKVATYKQILANTCRDYETTLHAQSSESIDAHLIEIRDTSPSQAPVTGDEHEVSCPIGWIAKTGELGHTRCVGAPLN